MWSVRLCHSGYEAVVERVFAVRIDAFDWNCPQHITPQFTANQLQEALAALWCRPTGWQESRDDRPNQHQCTKGCADQVPKKWTG
jgi:hypothetical protein